jgi:hypothetical protein
MKRGDQLIDHSSNTGKDKNACLSDVLWVLSALAGDVEGSVGNADLGAAFVSDQWGLSGV